MSKIDEKEDLTQEIGMCMCVCVFFFCVFVSLCMGVYVCANVKKNEKYEKKKMRQIYVIS